MWIKVSVVLLGLAILLGLLYGYERHSNVRVRAEAKEAIQTAQETSQELTRAHESFRVDLDAMKHTQEVKASIIQETIKVKEKVDAVAAKVQAGEISDAASDKLYIDSMWEAYCQAEDNPACSGRKLH